MGLTVLKSRCQQGRVPSGGSREEFVSCLSQYLVAACISWFVAPSFILKTRSVALQKVNLSLYDFLFSLPFPLIKTLVITLDPPGYPRILF